MNHWGTILTKEPLPLDESDAYYPKDTEYYSGVELTLEEYQTGLYPEKNSHEQSMT